jgi:hypothetical protein
MCSDLRDFPSPGRIFLPTELLSRDRTVVDQGALFWASVYLA